jgi:hypothetical protein
LQDSFPWDMWKRLWYSGRLALLFPWKVQRVRKLLSRKRVAFLIKKMLEIKAFLQSLTLPDYDIKEFNAYLRFGLLTLL